MLDELLTFDCGVIWLTSGEQQPLRTLTSPAPCSLKAIAHSRAGKFDHPKVQKHSCVIGQKCDVGVVSREQLAFTCSSRVRCIKTTKYTNVSTLTQVSTQPHDLSIATEAFFFVWRKRFVCQLVVREISTPHIPDSFSACRASLT